MGSLALLQPAFLMGLFALAIPIIIHFIYRKKAVRWRFAAMEFLMRSHRKVARRLKLKQFLLLLLRCLLFAFVVFAFARPFLKQARGGSPSKARAIVLIVDDSMSMSYKESGASTSLFVLAKKRAATFLSQLRGEDQVALLRGSASQHTQLYEQLELTFDKKSVIDKLNKWKPSFRTTDLSAAMQRGAAIVEKAKGREPLLVVISDFARHALDSSKMPKLSSLPAIKLLPVRSKKAPSNRAIIGLKTEPAPFASNDAYQFTVTVQNFSKQPVKDLPVLVKLGKKAKAKGFIQLGSLAIVQKRFIIRLPRAGVYTGSIELGKDGLEADNHFYFALQARQRPRVLLVNGDPRTIPYLDELFYVERALRDPASPFVLKSIHASAKLPPPSQFQAIFLVNVPHLPSHWVAALHQFVRKGGGLFFSMGDQVSVADMNIQFGSLLPRPLRRTALAAQRPDGTGIALQRYFGEVSANHPIFRPLYRDGLVFQSARVSRLMLVQTRKSKQGGSVLWRFSHGAPALLERRVGQGRVLLLTTTLDRDWTDLCIRPFFQPWLKQLTTYMAGGSRFQQRKSLTIDQATKVPFAGTGAVTLHFPNGKTRVLRPLHRMLAFAGGHIPGIYRFSRDGKKLSLLPQIVNVDPRESDLRLIPEKELKSVGSLSTQASSIAFQQSERLWPFLLLSLFMFFFIESAILRFM